MILLGSIRIRLMEFHRICVLGWPTNAEAQLMLLVNTIVK